MNTRVADKVLKEKYERNRDYRGSTEARAHAISERLLRRMTAPAKWIPRKVGGYGPPKPGPRFQCGN